MNMIATTLSQLASSYSQFEVGSKESDYTSVYIYRKHTPPYCCSLDRCLLKPSPLKPPSLAISSPPPEIVTAHSNTGDRCLLTCLFLLLHSSLFFLLFAFIRLFFFPFLSIFLLMSIFLLFPLFSGICRIGT